MWANSLAAAGGMITGQRQIMGETSSMSEDLGWRVRQFIAQFCAVDCGRIHNSATLLGDLGIDGDDAVDFFQEFRDEFGVDLSSLELSRHFGPEGLPLWAPLLPFVWLVNAMHSGRHKQKLGLAPISVMDLIDAAARGKWELE